MLHQVIGAVAGDGGGDFVVGPDPGGDGASVGEEAAGACRAGVAGQVGLGPAPRRWCRWRARGGVGGRLHARGGGLDGDRQVGGVEVPVRLDVDAGRRGRRPLRPRPRARPTDRSGGPAVADDDTTPQPRRHDRRHLRPCPPDVHDAHERPPRTRLSTATCGSTAPTTCSCVRQLVVHDRRCGAPDG